MEGDCNVYAHPSLWMRPTRPDRYNMRMVYSYHIYYYDCKLTCCTHLLWFLSFYQQFETIGFKKWRIIIQGAFVMNNMVLYTKAPFVFMFGKSSLITTDTHFLWTCSNTCRNQDSYFQQSKFCSTFMPLPTFICFDIRRPWWSIRSYL